jgi:hypothetical protein
MPIKLTLQMSLNININKSIFRQTFRENHLLFLWKNGQAMFYPNRLFLINNMISFYIQMKLLEKCNWRSAK